MPHSRRGSRSSARTAIRSTKPPRDQFPPWTTPEPPPELWTTPLDGLWTTPVVGLWITPPVGVRVTPVEGGGALVVDGAGATVDDAAAGCGLAGGVRCFRAGVGTARWRAATEACGA